MSPHALYHRIAIAAAALLCPAAPLLHAQWVNYPTPGAPRTANGKIDLSAPAPRTADGKPDLSGVWESDTGYFTDLARDLKSGEVQMLPWAKDLQHERESRDHADDPMARCMPPGVPRISMSANSMPHPFKVVMTPKLIILLYETSANQTFRQVFMDGRPLPTDPQPTWLGYSIGHWDGDSLVVETTGFNGREWVDTAKGHPQTDAARVTERFSRPDYGHLQIVITIDDPKAYEKPWTAKVPIHLLPDTDLIETYCESEKDQPHMHSR